MTAIAFQTPPGLSLLQRHARALSLIAQYGSNHLAYLHKRPGMTVFFDSQQHACLAWRRSRRFAVVLGDPIGPRDALPRLVQEFSQYCRANRLRDTYCGLSSQAAVLIRAMGYRLLYVGDEAVMEFPMGDLSGGDWRECRVARHRASRQGYEIRVFRPGLRDVGLLTQLHRVSDDWLARRKLPELGFAMSTSHDIADPNTLLAAAYGPSGSIKAFTTWNPNVVRHGWCLDLMRYRHGTVAGLMDAVIAQSLLWMEENGYHAASLGGTPLSNESGNRQGVLRLAMDTAFKIVTRPYGFKSLHHFKQKFNPHWQPLYVAAPHGVSMVAATYAIAKAVAQTASALRVAWMALRR